VVLKVIIESAALSEEQIVFACRVGQQAGADYLKTSTGMHKAGGASAGHVRLMAQAAPRCKIKAAGGIRTAEQALAMIEAGASRLGSSASVQILEGFASAAGQKM
jgi:deoxyribose-phosphate aldolase